MTMLRSSNRTETEALVDRRFSSTDREDVKFTERRLLAAVGKALEASGVPIDGRQPLRSFGSTARGTHNDDDIDFDLSVGLESLPENEERLHLECRSALHECLVESGFAPASISDFGSFRKKYWYKLTVMSLANRKAPFDVKKIDLTLTFPGRFNIGCINHEVLSSLFNRIEANLGREGKEHVIRHIRFTKWLFKREWPVIDSRGAVTLPLEKEKISDKGGLTSILTEHVLVQLCRKTPDGRITRPGSFDSLMRLVNEVDRRGAKSTERREEQLISLEEAQASPRLKQVRRCEVVAQARRLSKIEGFVVPARLEESIFDLLSCQNKWFILAKMARAYTQEDGFIDKYLSRD